MTRISLPSLRRWMRCCGSGVGSVRTSPTWGLLACEGWGWRRVMSAAIWKRCRRPANHSVDRRRRLAPGWRSMCRESAGRSLTQPMIACLKPSMSHWPGARDYGDVAPLTGVMTGGGSHFAESVGGCRTGGGSVSGEEIQAGCQSSLNPGILRHPPVRQGRRVTACGRPV